MINKELVKNKMADLQGYLQELEPLLNEESKEIIENNLKLRTVERLFQLIVDTAIDINTHIITESNFTVPDDYQSTFMVLAKNNLMPMAFANQIAPSVGLRNLIVHKYGRVDLEKMVDDIKSEIDQFLEYVKYISNFVSG